MLIGALALWSSVAVAGPTVHIEATVADDLRSVEGVMTLPQEWVPTLADPLARLPEPPDDLHLLRTYPGRPSRGSVKWTILGPDQVAFTAVLPKRYDDIGWTAEGLFANGAWYPQPSPDDDPLPLASWDVRVTLPSGRVGALGSVADQGILAWEGVADRVPLAVLRRARLTQLGGEHWSADVLTPRRARPILVRELVLTLDAVASESMPLRGVIVEGPLRRRLARPAPGLLYLSDRAFRLTPPLQRFHRVAITRGLVSAWVDQPDPFLRNLAGAGVGLGFEEDLKGMDADELLNSFRWLPQIHWLLANGRMPFYSEVLERVHPSDPLRDDLGDLFAPHAPATAVVVQAEDEAGEGVGVRLGLALAEGASEADALESAGLGPDWLSNWRRELPDQDYQLSVDRKERTVTLERIAPEDAPIETAIVRIDGVDHVRTGGPGSTTWTVDEAPRQVSVDPGGHLAQSSRVGDRWPERYMVTFSAGITSINLTRLQFFGAGAMTLRRAYDTHNLWRGLLYNSQSDLIGAQLSWMHQEGPQRTGWSRPHRITLWANSSLLNPGFADTDGLKPTIGGGTSYAHDNRVYSDFPLRGHRVALALSGGVVPALGESWLHTGPSGVGVVALHPRHALAFFGSATVARSNVPHRKLALGGPSAMRSLPALPACPEPTRPRDRPCQALADARAVAAFEYRVAPLRNVSVPLALAWGSELQLTGGLETVVAQVAGEPASALGATVGVTGIADMLGAEPYLGGLTIGWPLWWSPQLEGVDQQGWPEIYLRWSQEF